MLCGSWLHLLPARKPALQSSKRGKPSLEQPVPNCLTSTAAPRSSSMCRVQDPNPPQRKSAKPDAHERLRSWAFVFATVACETKCQGTASAVQSTALKNKTPCAAGPRAAPRDFDFPLTAITAILGVCRNFSDRRVPSLGSGQINSPPAPTLPQSPSLLQCKTRCALPDRRPDRRRR